MINILQDAYRNSKLVRVGATIGLCLYAIVLFMLGGGLPPWSWRLLWQIRPTLPQLFAERGLGVLIPLTGLFLLALTLLLLWITLIVAAIKLAAFWWELRQEQDRLTLEMAEAEAMAEDMLYQQQMQQVTNQRMQPRQTSRVAMPMPSLPPTIPPVTPVAQMPAVALAGNNAVNLHYRETLPIAPAVPARGGLHLLPRETQQPEASSIDFNDPSHQQNDYVDNVDDPIDDDVDQKASQQLSSDEDAQDAEDIEEVEDAEEDNAINAIEEYNTVPTLHEQVAQQAQQLHEEQELRLAVGLASDPGVVRRNSPNEDSLLALQGTHLTNTGLLPLGLFVVADGMGGHAHGREASRTAIRAISDVVAPVLLRPNAEEELYTELLKDGVQRANLAIYQRNRQQAHMMGTTLTAALVFGDTAHVVNVGDSRTYLYRPSRGLMQISRDHSIVARLVEKGLITPNDVYSHPKRNQIYRCLGEHTTVELDSFKVSLQPEDVLLLCSDGLWEMVHDHVIEKIVRASNPHASQISSMLLQAALNNGGADNVSIVVVCVMGE